MTDNDKPHSSQVDHATRQTRLLILVLGVFSLALVGGLISMVFLVSDEVRVNAVGPIAPTVGAERGGLVFKGTIGVWEINGRQIANAARQVHFLIDLIDPVGQPAPPTLEIGLLLDPPESGLPSVPLTPVRVGPGRYTASAELPANGRWLLRIQLSSLTGLFHFQVDP